VSKSTGVRLLARDLPGGQARDGEVLSSSRTTIKSVMAGAACALLLVTIGLIALGSQPPDWRAEAALVVVPERGLDPALAAGYYETLSRGQILATFSQTLALPRYVAEATEQVGGPAAPATSVEVDVIPETAVIRVSAVGPEPAAAEGVVDALLGVWGRDIGSLRMPYVASVISPAAGSAQQTDVAGVELVAVILFVGAVAGLAVQQAVYHLAMLRIRTPAVGQQNTRKQQKPGT
jgi:hypothetical protein